MKKYDIQEYLDCNGFEALTSSDGTKYYKEETVISIALEVVKKCSIPDVSNFVLLANPNYKAKDGTIKRGIEIDGKYYAPQNDC